MNDFVSHAARATAHLRDNDRLAGLSLVIEQRILDGSKLTTCYHLVLGDRAARVHDGPADRPDVTIEQDSATALALRNGEIHAQNAFLTGRLTVRGDVQKLVDHGQLLGELLGGGRA